MAKGTYGSSTDLTSAQILYLALQGGLQPGMLGKLEYLGKTEKKSPEQKEKKEKIDFMEMLSKMARPPLKYKFLAKFEPTGNPERISKSMLELDERPPNISVKNYSEDRNKNIREGREYGRQGKLEPFIRIFAEYEKRGIFSRGKPVPLLIEIEVNNEEGIEVMLGNLEKQNFGIDLSEAEKFYQEMQEGK